MCGDRVLVRLRTVDYTLSMYNRIVDDAIRETVKLLAKYLLAEYGQSVRRHAPGILRVLDETS